MKTIEEILKERAATHGSFKDHAECTQAFKSILHNSKNWGVMSPRQKEALEMIVHKFGRILCGDPNVHDHWDDVGGYNRLVIEDLNEGEKK